MSDVLRRVKQAAQTRQKATRNLDREYVKAIQAAARQHTYAEIARAAGTTRQNIRQLILGKEKRA